MRYGLAMMIVARLLAQEPASNTQAFKRPCDFLWPHAVQVFVKSGFNVKSSDKDGGVLALEWRKGGQFARFGDVNDSVKAYTIGKTGFWDQYRAFSVGDATVLFAPTEDGCQVEANVTFFGWKKRMFDVGRWYTLESNHLLERDLLNQLAGRIGSAAPSTAAEPPKQSPPKTEAKVESKSAEPPQPDPPKQQKPVEKERPPDTQVVRLPG